MEKIRLSKSSIGLREKEAVIRVLDREYLGMGDEVRLFEEEIKRFLRAEREVICVNTGTSALHLALACLGIGPGDEVLVPTITYIASFQAISATGAVPVACDVLEDTIFIDLADASRRITSKTRAIMPVHYASNSEGIDDVYSFARKFSLRVIEDAAHAFGCVRRRNRIGGFGDIICFSFDGIKNITSGEGGAIITSDGELAARLRDARLLGVENDTEQRYSGQRSWEFNVTHQGFRYHMSNIMAAIGRVQLDNFDLVKHKRQEIAQFYLRHLKNIPDIELMRFKFSEIVPHIFVIKVKQGRRDELRTFLAKHNIESGIHYLPNHLLTKYQSSYSLPIAEKLYGEILSLPIHLDLNHEQLNVIISAIREFFNAQQ